MGDNLSGSTRTTPPIGKPPADDRDIRPGHKVGIGVATGADRVFISSGKPDGVESDRLIELVLPKNIGYNAIEWTGHYLVNPFAEGGGGKLVDLAQYPGLAAYLLPHEQSLRLRHVARSRPHAWFKRSIGFGRSSRPNQSFFLPDIQDPTSPTVGVDTGRYYPHHNLYFVVSDSWPLLALRTVALILRGRAGSSCSVQMRGGAVRWQAQTLRNVRLPALLSLSDQLVGELAEGRLVR